MPIGVSSAPYVKFTKAGDRHGGEIVDFRVTQTTDMKTRSPLYLEETIGGGWEKTFAPFRSDGRPNDPICQWEVTVETGEEDENGDTERRIFIDPRKGKRGTTLEGKRGGDAIANALKKAKAHRVGLEIGGTLFVTFHGRIPVANQPDTGTWSAEYEPPSGGIGTGRPVDEMPWLVGGKRYDKGAELARWEARVEQPALARSVAAAQAASSGPSDDPWPTNTRGTTPAEQQALDRLRGAQATRQAPEDEEPPF